VCGKIRSRWVRIKSYLRCILDSLAQLEYADVVSLGVGVVVGVPDDVPNRDVDANAICSPVGLNPFLPGNFSLNFLFFWCIQPSI
jgi:hypothetical protein